MCMLVVCSLNINTAMAQSRSYEGGITVNPVRLEQKGDFIHVDIDFVLNNVKVKSARGMDFIPRLVTPGYTQNLPKVSIKGRDEYLAYERELALMSAKEKRNYEKPYIVEKAGKLRNDTIRYQYLVPFESSDKKLQITLALSLHASSQEKRLELMPVANKYEIHEVIEACRYYFEQTGRRVTFEYSLGFVSEQIY